MSTQVWRSLSDFSSIYYYQHRVWPQHWVVSLHFICGTHEYSTSPLSTWHRRPPMLLILILIHIYTVWKHGRVLILGHIKQYVLLIFYCLKFVLFLIGVGDGFGISLTFLVELNEFLEENHILVPFFRSWTLKPECEIVLFQMNCFYNGYRQVKFTQVQVISWTMITTIFKTQSFMELVRLFEMGTKKIYK